MINLVGKGFLQPTVLNDEQLCQKYTFCLETFNTKATQLQHTDRTNSMSLMSIMHDAVETHNTSKKAGVTMLSWQKHLVRQNRLLPKRELYCVGKVKS